MGNEKVVSFIIPAYNAQRYLAQCLDSFVFHQEEELSRFEVIVVDDGSADDTADVAQKYVRKDPDIFRLVRKTNGGHGSVINSAVSAVQGKYIRIIDADDWIEPHSLKPYLDALEAAQADVVLTSFRVYYEGTGEIENWSMRGSGGKVLSLEEVVQRWGDFVSCLTFHGVTYRTDFYRENRISLSEKVSYDDAEFSTVPLCRASSILPLGQYLYAYRMGNEGQSVSDTNRIAKLSQLEQIITRLCSYLAQESGRMTRAMTLCCRNRIAAIAGSCLVTPLLRFSDRREGRNRAWRIYGQLSAAAPEVATMLKRKYLIMVLMNRCGISLAAIRRYVHSPFFQWLKWKL